MGKRSPILGYNHNVRYRGLVFHVQTEDSGVSTPHLFTHLFHHGVIVSTRKLVYDAGSAEESIKSLMQAQHKATLKDLRRGHFDDKIDSYLGGTPGLLPRGSEESADRPSESELPPSPGTVEEVAIGVPTDQVLPMVFDDLSDTVMVVEKASPPAGRPAIPPVPARTTSEQPVPLATARSMPASVDTTLKTAVPAFDSSPEPDFSSSSSAELEIQLELELDDPDEADDLDEADVRAEAAPRPRRAARDTEMQVPFNDMTRPTLDVKFNDHTRPTVGMIHEQARRATAISDGVPGQIQPSSPAIRPSSPAIRPSNPAIRPSNPAIRPSNPAIRPSNPAIPPPLPDSRRLGERPSTINAATLPPARPIARPPSRPALVPPQVVSRPVTSDDRSRREPEASEVHPPAPPSAELSPGERAGQYAQHKKGSPRSPEEGKHERSGGVAIPAGLGRPQRVGTSPTPIKSSTAPVPSGAAQPPALRESSPQSVNHTEPLVGRSPTPARIAPPGASRAGVTSGSGVVMTRPAVIVGAPARSVGTVPRIRKAREDEGRGFGQGLISEKSLDEVILAYLSEDADDK